MSKPIPADANVISNPYVIRGGVMINSNQPKIAIFAVAMAILGSAALVANLGRMAYALENATNATGVTGVLTITKYVESLVNALKAKYPKLAALTGAEDGDLIRTLKELKDAKETAKTSSSKHFA